MHVALASLSTRLAAGVFAASLRSVSFVVSRQLHNKRSPMPRTVYIGKKTTYCGKRVFEILCNLRNFGIGRVLQRNQHKTWFEEPCFLKIARVEPQMDDELAFGRVWVEEVYRGRRYPYLTEIKPWHPDYSLVPKDEEPDFSKFPVLGEDKSFIKVLPQTFKVPPLMAEYLNRKRLGFYPNIYVKGLNKQQHGYDAKSLTEFSIPYRYLEQQNEEFDFYYRIADEAKGEKPTEDLDNLFISPRLFKDVVRDNSSGGDNNKK